MAVVSVGPGGPAIQTSERQMVLPTNILTAIILAAVAYWAGVQLGNSFALNDALNTGVLLGYTFAGVSFSGSSGESKQLTAIVVSGNYFDVLGVKAQLGRTFLPDEDKTPGTNPVVVLSYGSWQRDFGGDPSRRLNSERTRSASASRPARA